MSSPFIRAATPLLALSVGSPVAPKRLLRSLFFLIVLTVSPAGCIFTSSRYQLLEDADHLTQEGEFDAAIAKYQEHIQFRLREKKRPLWENPYFYLLSIGDLELRKNDPESAIRRYEDAEQHDVEAGLVSDRFRFVASWYVERGRVTEGISLLQKYRSRDPLLFDAMLDRFSKALVAQEDQGVAISASTEGEAAKLGSESERATPPVRPVPTGTPSAVESVAPVSPSLRLEW